MEISKEEFEKIVGEEIDSLPEKTMRLINNVAFLVEDYPTAEQIKNARLGTQFELFGLYEGYIQSSRRNLGTVLPDRITLFRKAIMRNCRNLEELKKQVRSTIKHEIAHHFGSDEHGARKAGK